MVGKVRAEKYHRLESPTQTPEDAIRQVSTAEIWGKPPRIGGSFPSVKAYRGVLPPGRRGIEFTTTIAPDTESSSPFEARWVYPTTPGVMVRYDESGDQFAAIPANVINRQP